MVMQLLCLLHDYDQCCQPGSQEKAQSATADHVSPEHRRLIDSQPFHMLTSLVLPQRILNVHPIDLPGTSSDLP